MFALTHSFSSPSSRRLDAGVPHHGPLLPNARQGRARHDSRRVETRLGIAVFIVLAGLVGAVHMALRDMPHREGAISRSVGIAPAYVAANVDL